MVTSASTPPPCSCLHFYRALCPAFPFLARRLSSNFEWRVLVVSSKHVRFLLFLASVFVSAVLVDSIAAGGGVVRFR